MKALFIFSFLQLLLLSPVFPQQTGTAIKPNLKYGKPSKEELSLTTFTPDTTATAIYLFRQGESKFTYRDGFQLETEYWVRIKVLKPQGVSYADVTVFYYAPADKDADQENAINVDGCSYTLENGECIKTPLKKDMISYERVNERAKAMKFSIPAVKAGSVIEYHYLLRSDYSVHIDNWIMQEEIPMVYNQYKVTIPNVYIYNIERRGSDCITTKERESSMRASSTHGSGAAKINQDFAVQARELTFISQNLPAIRQDESFIWCPEDYKVQITFDLQGTNFPGEEYKPLSQKWEDVDKELTKPEYESFGKNLLQNNPFREDTRVVFKSEMNFDQRIVAAFHLLKKKLAWNGQYQLYSRNPEKIVKDGSGSNADLNFIFISILKDFGLKAYPVVMSRRSSGVLPFNFPSIQKLNTFAVAIYNDDTAKYTFLDSSMDRPAFNVLPIELSVSKARILSPLEKEEDKWVNLMTLPTNGVFMHITATLQNDQITGTRITQLQGQQAVEYQRKEQQERPASAYEASSINKEYLQFSNLKATNPDNEFSRVEESISFTAKPTNTAGRLLYINPMIFPHIGKNPFIQTERVLPVEFPYPYKYNVTCTLTIPEGYTIEELPQPQTVRTEDNKMQCRYLIQKDNNVITLNYAFTLKDYLFAPNQYKLLQEIWTKTIEKNQALIVLKKL